MDTTKTAIERATELAFSGQYASLAHVVLQLQREGFATFQIAHSSLGVRLHNAIAQATSVEAAPHVKLVSSH